MKKYSINPIYWISIWFSRMLRKSLHIRRLRIQELFNRSLPTGDLIFDRWDVASFNGFGNGTTCYASVLVIGDVSVGKNCWIGPNVILDGSGGLKVGDNVHISAGSQLYTHDSIANAISVGSDQIQRESTLIGDGVYIGPNSIIQKGVTIGNSAIIGALSLVNRNVPEGGKFLGIRLQE